MSNQRGAAPKALLTASGLVMLGLIGWVFFALPSSATPLAFQATISATRLPVGPTATEGTPAPVAPPDYFPIFRHWTVATPTPQPVTLTPLPPPTPVSANPPIDFEQVRQDLNDQGLELAFNKVGFHVGPGGNASGLGDWMAQLDAAGVPFLLKTVDSAGAVYEAQQLKLASGVLHTLIYRSSTAGQNDGNSYDVPNYSLPPAEAAWQHWQLHKAAWPAELNPAEVWIETLNEVDKGRAEWLAEFAIETAYLAMADGFRWAAFAWSSGEPEPAHWRGPKMREFLALAALYPDQIAIALHEYSYSMDLISNGYPYLVGRIQDLFRAADEFGLARPTVLITEWGWEYQRVPDPDAAMADIRWAAWLYAAYPEVKGAAIWYLGGGSQWCDDERGHISDQAQRLIAPVRDYSLANYFITSPGRRLVDPETFPPNPPTLPQLPATRVPDGC